MEPEQEISLVDKAFAIHEHLLIYHVLLKLDPTLAAIGLAATGIHELWKRRGDIFVTRLIELKIDPPAERLRERDFLEGLAATLRRVQDSVADEKIRSFADMFATYYEGGHFQSVDHFDEYLSILHELSLREFRVLVILHKYEHRNPLEGRNPLQRATAVWESFQQEVELKVGIPHAQLAATLTRIQRTGLYETITGAFLDYTGGKGCLTPLFHDFLSTLRIPIHPSGAA
jgi:hypothetical protein